MISIHLEFCICSVVYTHSGYSFLLNRAGVAVAPSCIIVERRSKPVKGSRTNLKCFLCCLFCHMSVFEKWQNVLVEHGFKGDGSRQEHLARFLVENQITKLEHLRYADHPREWLGAQDITAEEQEYVWKLKRVARSRSR